MVQEREEGNMTFEYNGKTYKSVRTAKAAITRAEGVEGQKIAVKKFGGETLDKYISRFMTLTSSDYAVGHPQWRKLSHKKVAENKYPKVTKGIFYRHLGEIEDNVLYFCARPHKLESGEGTVVHVTVDLDNENHLHLHQSNRAQMVLEDLERRLQSLGVVFVTQVSTSCSGFHVHFCILLTTNPSFSRIRSLLAQLRTLIQSCYANSGCSEVCLKGLPFVSHDEKPAEFGTLVRSPLPRNEEEALELIHMTDNPFEYEKLYKGFSDGPLSSSRKKTNPANHSLPLAPSFSSPLLPIQVISKGRHSVDVCNSARHGRDPLSRMNHAAARFTRENQRFPTDESELVDYYTEEGYSTPMNDTNRSYGKRLLRAAPALEWIRANHSFKLPSRMTLYNHWLKVIDGFGLTKEDRTYSKSGRSIHSEHVALAMAMIEQNILKGDGSTPKTFAINGSRRMKSDGDIDFTLDNTKFAKATSILREHGLIAIARESERGIATLYKYGSEYKGQALERRCPNIGSGTKYGGRSTVTPS